MYGVLFAFDEDRVRGAQCYRWGIGGGLWDVLINDVRHNREKLVGMQLIGG